MPRSRKTQAPKAPGDQAYGAAGEQIAAQQAMPLPDTRSAPPTPPAAGSSPPAAGGDPLAAALGMAPPAPAPWAGDTVLDQQITAGLPIGPGPGPEVLGLAQPPPAPVSQMLLQMADATGDPYLAELAQQAQGQGA